MFTKNPGNFNVDITYVLNKNQVQDDTYIYISISIYKTFAVVSFKLWRMSKADFL